MIFIKLLLAHLLGDFLLQPHSWVINKEAKKQRSAYLYLHIAIHGLLALALVGETGFALYAIILAVTHGIIDFLKLFFQRDETRRNWFVIDQVLHLFLLAIIAMLYSRGEISIEPPTNNFWIVFTGVLLLTKPTSIIIKNIISVWTPRNMNDAEDDSLQNAGKYIGILERLFVLIFILTDHFEAIGFLLAAKSIFRFGDLMEARERKLTEYVLIGTLLSFGIAIVTALLVKYAIFSLEFLG